MAQRILQNLHSSAHLAHIAFTRIFAHIPRTGRVWKGSAFGGVKGRSELPAIVDDYMKGELKVDEFITHRYPLDEINSSFDVMHAGKSIRAVVEFAQQV